MDNPLDIITETLDKITSILNDIGVEVSALQSQIGMLVVTIAVLYGMRRYWWPLSSLDGKSIAMIAAPVLIVIAICMSWAGQLLNPPEKSSVQGYITFNTIGKPSLELLSSDGQSINLTPGVIDPDTGAFFVLYKFGLAHYPRKIQVKHIGCESLQVPVTLNQLRSQHTFQINFECANNE